MEYYTQHTIYIKLQSKKDNAKITIFALNNNETMDLTSSFSKALLLLDEGKIEQAVTLLQEVVTESQEANDVQHFVQANCALGEFYFNNAEWDKALSYLELVIGTPMSDEMEEALASEINNAKQMLQEM
ncbi:hypothetical protein LX64_00864 [Chitinophaga skermanii]|uniref:Tetratricopeptide repeat protein n=2 Tax=Chitinophaga skermanii TaxID=331697 RepID=A0A327R2V0_9BACT|nr:hypothetical protein LX64_00864 [Chitinophaga skermanii]